MLKTTAAVALRVGLLAVAGVALALGAVAASVLIGANWVVDRIDRAK